MSILSKSTAELDTAVMVFRESSSVFSPSPYSPSDPIPSYNNAGEQTTFSNWEKSVDLPATSPGAVNNLNEILENGDVFEKAVHILSIFTYLFIYYLWKRATFYFY